MIESLREKKNFNDKADAMNIKGKRQWEGAFEEACQEGQLEGVRHLCQKQYLDRRWADIHALNEYGFRFACSHGHLNVVKYLLTSHELKAAGHTFANLHASDECGLRWACENGHLEVLKYLLTSRELIEAGHTFANLHVYNDWCFQEACKNEHWNVVRWLVLDYGLEKTPNIQEILEEYPQAQEYFRVREELQAIQGVLQNNGTGNRHDSIESSERTDTRVAQKSKKL